MAKWREEREEKEVLVTAEDMMHIISKVTGVPLQRMEQKETQKLLAMEAELRQRVIGQDEAVTRNQQSVATFPRGSEGPETADWLVCFPGTDRCRKDIPGAHPG